MRPEAPLWCPHRVMQMAPSQEEDAWPLAGTCPAWVPGCNGEEALSNLWLRVEASGGEGGCMLAFGVGGSLCAFQLSSALLASWGSRVL